MYEFKEKKRLRKFLYSKVTLGLLALFVVFVGKGTWNIYTKEREALLSRLDIERQVAALEAREVFLNTEVDRLKTEKGIEREIREKFNVKRDGETVVVIIDSTTTGSVPAYPESVPQKIWSWFKATME